MGRKAINLTGKKFGKLTVLSIDEGKLSGAGRHKFWICHCDCGKVISVSSSHLTSGVTKSCGCLRTVRSLNKYTTEKRGIRVYFNQGKGSFICDSDIWEQLKQFTRYRAKNGYVCASVRVDGKHRVIYFHHYVIDCPPGFVRDHINRDKLDNRRSNLRVLTIPENVKNSDYFDEKRKQKHEPN